VDEREFRELYRDHSTAVFTYARRRLDRSDAEDLVADVFLIVWRRGDERPDDPRAWLLGVARRTLANRLRAQRRAGALAGRLAHEPSLAPVDGEPDSDAEIRRALATLGDDDRELLELLTWDGLTRPQLAAVFGVSTGTIAVRVHRAKRRLAHALASSAQTHTVERAETHHQLTGSDHA
jgi:RNA polymerase sigma-70 factor (ECF subfamily)